MIGLLLDLMRHDWKQDRQASRKPLTTTGGTLIGARFKMTNTAITQYKTNLHNVRHGEQNKCCVIYTPSGEHKKLSDFTCFQLM